MINVDAQMTKTLDGVWIPFGGSKFLVAHISSIAFQRKLARLQQPYKVKIEKGTIDPKLQREITCEAMTGTILKDWQDVVNNEGSTVPFSEEVAKTVLVKQHDLRDFISNFAVELENFREEAAKDLGN